MTAPVVHGYPDWGRYAAAVDKLYFNITRNPAAPVETLSPTFVGDVPALYADFSALAKNFQIQMVFYADSTATVSVGAHVFDVLELGQFDIVVPVLGPYVAITITESAVGGAWIMKLASCIGQRSGLGKGSAVNVMMSQVATAVGAGVTVTVNTTIPKPGPAIVMVDTSLANWLATVNVVDYLGAVTRLDTITNLSQVAPRPLELPARPLQFTFKNNTGAAGSFTMALCGRMAWPGS